MVLPIISITRSNSILITISKPLDPQLLHHGKMTAITYLKVLAQAFTGQSIATSADLTRVQGLGFVCPKIWLIWKIVPDWLSLEI